MESLNAVDILYFSDAASDLNHQTQIRPNQAPIIALSQSQHLTPGPPHDWGLVTRL